MKLRNWLTGKRISRVGFCPVCGQFSFNIQRRRQSTAYVNDESNWDTMCPPCQDERDKYWEDMWREHYRSCL